MDQFLFPREAAKDFQLADEGDPILGAELSCPVLDELYPHLHFVAVKSSSHIEPLHVHLRKGREIRITEDPSLHLVWSYSHIWIKPLPSFLLKSNIWDTHLAFGQDKHSQHRLLALGFIRSYSYLIRHRSDYLMAKEANLLPFLKKDDSEDERPGEYLRFRNFLEILRNLPDHWQRNRWHFGQFRLSRLNWAVRILQPTPRSNGMLRRLYYEEEFQQSSQFIRDAGPMLLFVFAALSLVLSSMQVTLAARSGGSWEAFASVSAGFLGGGYHLDRGNACDFSRDVNSFVGATISFVLGRTG
ncbi:hypothetical protein F5B20DRAFT_552943 [Whalleya microplaca]|nr:hypothetical protein F5B20DRAFT_552943 [Whalleya microplaca]